MQRQLSKGLLIWQVYMEESTLPTDNRNFRGQTNRLTFCLLFDIIWLVIANWLYHTYKRTFFNILFFVLSVHCKQKTDRFKEIINLAVKNLPTTYNTLLTESSFIPVPCNEKISSSGNCWSLLSELGEEHYRLYAQKDLTYAECVKSEV